MRRAWVSLTVLLLLVATAGLPGCRTRKVAAENDRLRLENLELTRAVQATQDQLDRRETELAALREGQGLTPPEAQSPSLAELTLGRYSSLADADRNGTAETARLYLLPRDGDGRFLPVAGTAEVQVFGVTLPDDPDGDPVWGETPMAKRLLAEDEWDDAYRTGFTGTHYRVELPLVAVEPRPRAVGVRVTFHDSGSGGLFRAEAVLLWPKVVIPADAGADETSAD